MLLLERIADERIREAFAAGEFDRLPGAGRALELDDDSAVPEELRVAYRVLKNAGLAPPELGLRRSIVELEAAIDTLTDDGARAVARRRLALLRTRLEGRPGVTAGCGYERAVLSKLAARG